MVNFWFLYIVILSKISHSLKIQPLFIGSIFYNLRPHVMQTEILEQPLHQANQRTNNRTNQNQPPKIWSNEI
jgi:hypothetical protein